MTVSRTPIFAPTSGSATLTTPLWFWPNGKTALQKFFHQLNSQYLRIRFNMEQEQNNAISFLGAEVTRQADGTLAHTVHHKPTHTNRYVHNSLFHHPRFKSAVSNTLVRWTLDTCDKGSLKQELQHIKTSRQLNGYKTFNLSEPKPSLTPDELPEFKAAISLPNIGLSSHKLQRIFIQAQVKTFHTASNKIQASLNTHKDKQDTRDKASVYHIPCDYCEVYIVEPGRNISTRIKEHKAHGTLEHLNNSAIIKYSHEHDSIIKWNQAKLIAHEQSWHQCRVGEAIDIQARHTVPEDIGFFINDIWSHILKPTLPAAAHHKNVTLQCTHIQPAINSHALPAKNSFDPSRPNAHPSSTTKARPSPVVQHSHEDERSILFTTSRPNRVFPEPILTLRGLHMVVPVNSYFSTPCKASNNTYPRWD